MDTQVKVDDATVEKLAADIFAREVILRNYMQKNADEIQRGDVDLAKKAKTARKLAKFFYGQL